MPRYDYACKCGAVVEETRGYEEDSIPCSSCSATAKRVPVYLVAIHGETVAKSGFSRPMFQEVTQELDYAHTQAENEVGHELPSPNVYKHAMARAEGIDPNLKSSRLNAAANKRAKQRELKEAINAER